MARGKAAPKPNSNRNVEYVNVDLTKDMKAALVQWVEQGADFFDLIEKTLDSGLKFSAKYDDFNECFQATFTLEPTKPGDGSTLVLAGRGGTVLQAVQALLYKYWVVLQCELENAEQRNARGITDWG